MKIENNIQHSYIMLSCLPKKVIFVLRPNSYELFLIFAFMCKGNATNFFSIRIYLCFSLFISCRLLFLLWKLVRYFLGKSCHTDRTWNGTLALHENIILLTSHLLTMLLTRTLSGYSPDNEISMAPQISMMVGWVPRITSSDIHTITTYIYI